jgi:hypothetical protein
MIVFTAAAIMSVTGALVSLLRGKPVRLDEPDPVLTAQDPLAGGKPVAVESPLATDGLQATAMTGLVMDDVKEEARK